MHETADHEGPSRNERHIAAAAHDAGFSRTPSRRRKVA